jgi:hypothetical protein
LSFCHFVSDEEKEKAKPPSKKSFLIVSSHFKIQPVTKKDCTKASNKNHDHDAMSV